MIRDFEHLAQSETEFISFHPGAATRHTANYQLKSFTDCQLSTELLLFPSDYYKANNVRKTV